MEEKKKFRIAVAKAIIQEMWMKGLIDDADKKAIEERTENKLTA